MSDGARAGGAAGSTLTWLVRPLVLLAAVPAFLWANARPESFGGLPLERTLWSGLFATVTLYLALLPGPLYAVFPGLPGERVWTRARRALGVVSAVFAGQHGYWGFFGWVGGWDGLRDWSADYNASLAFGAVAWAVLVLLAATSFDAAVRWLGRGWRRLHRAVYAAVRWLGRGWRRLHRAVYAAAVLVAAHAAIVTIHVVELMPWQVGWFAALALLATLELARWRRGATARARAWGWALYAPAMTVLFWSTFLVSHHRH